MVRRKVVIDRSYSGLPIRARPPNLLEMIEDLETMRLDNYKDGTIIADGSEQTLLECSEIARVMGYVDLSEMDMGDIVIIRQYVRVKPDLPMKKYAEETYSNKQTIPLVYLTPKELDYGMKFTLQQTTGAFKTFDYNFIREK